MNRISIKEFSYFLVLLICFSYKLVGQQIIDRKNLEHEQGLAHRIVLKAERNTSGYFYLFMRNYIQRYDGKEFIDIKIPQSENHLLPMDHLESVTALNDGGILAIFEGGKNSFFIPHNGLTVKALPVPKGARRLLVVDGKICVVYSKGREYAVSSYSSYPQKSTPLVHLSFLPHKLVKYQNSFLASDSLGSWYSCTKIGEECLSKQAPVWVSDGKLRKLESGIIYEKNAKIWNPTDTLPFTEDLTLITEDLKGCQLISHSKSRNSYDACFLVDTKGKWKPYNGLINTNKNFIGAISEDLHSVVLLYGFNGIEILSLMREGSKFYGQKNDLKKNEFGNIIMGISCDKYDRILAIEENQFCFRLNVQNDSFTPLLFPINLKRGKYRDFRALYYNEEEDVFYTSSASNFGSSLIYRIDLNNKQVNYRILSTKIIIDILPLGNEKVLVAIEAPKKEQKHQLGIYYFREQRYEEICSFSEELRSIQYINKRREYWIGLTNGLVILDEHMKLKYNFFNNLPDIEKFQNWEILTVLHYSHRIIAGTNGGGLIVIDPRSKKVNRRIRMDQGLNGNIVYSIIEDDQHQLWVGTENGLTVLDSSLNIVLNIYDHDGLSNREMNKKSVVKDSKGRLYFGTLNGITVLDPKIVSEWQRSYGVAIDEVARNQRNYNLSLEPTSKLRLYDLDTLQCHLTTPDYYAYPFEYHPLDYMIRGKINQSGKASDKHPIIINTHKKGKYNLKIKSPIGLKDILELEIKRNFMPLINFLISLFLVIILAFFISRYIIRSNKKIQEDRARLNKELNEMQLTALRAQMNPHFIFNALGSIQYYIYTNNKESADHYLSNFALLTRSILEHSKSKYIRLADEIKIQKMYIELEKMRFDEKFDFTINVADDVDPEILIPPMIIQPFIENAILHGLANLKNRKGKLFINFDMEFDNSLRCIVEDNGIGRSAAKELRMKKHEPRGMQIVQSRVNAFNASSELNMSIEIIDLKENGDDVGTRVIIRFILL